MTTTSALVAHPVPLLAWHSDPARKSRYLARVDEHRRLDQIVQGTGYGDGRGCAVGCTLGAYDHDRYPDELGVPVVLAYLEDHLFESIPVVDRDAWSWWPSRFLQAIEPGADLGGVWDAWAHWMLVDRRWGVVTCVEGEALEAAIRHAADVLHSGGDRGMALAAIRDADVAPRTGTDDAWVRVGHRAVLVASGALRDGAGVVLSARAALAIRVSGEDVFAEANAWTRAACDHLLVCLRQAPVGAAVVGPVEAV